MALIGPRIVLLVLFAAWLNWPAFLQAEEPKAVSAAAAAGELSGEDHFERKVRPLLVQHCHSCHAKGQKKGNLSLADRAGLLAGGDSGAVVVLEKPEESLLIQAVEHRAGTNMPPNGKLSDGEIAVLTLWIRQGAPWPASKGDANGLRTGGAITDEDRQFWSFQPVKNYEPPAVKNQAWPRNSLDRFVLAQLEANGLSPVGEADKRTWLRRATFDLIGLPPSPEDVQNFLADDSPAAYERVVNRLLDSPQYGERWARHWLDVARYGEDQAHTFQARMYPDGYRYRDWVVNAFNSDMPYDRFVIEQIAGDLLPEEPGRLERLPALGYLALGPVYYKDAGCAGKAESDEIDDRIDTLCRGFLGLTVSCARCHDHKFDPVTQRDYYGLAGVFASTQYREAPLTADDIVRQFDAKTEAIKGLEKRLADTQTAEGRALGETMAPLTAKYVAAAWRVQNPGDQKPNELAKKLAEEQGLQQFQIERWSQFLKSETARQRAYLAEYRQTLESLAGKPDVASDPAAVAAIEQAGALLQERLLAALSARKEQDTAYAQRLAAASDADKNQVEKPKYDPMRTELLKDLLGENNSPLFVPKDQLDKLLPEAGKTLLSGIQQELEQGKKDLGPKYPIAHSLTDGKPANAKIHLRGNHKDLGDEVPRQFLAVLSPADGKPFQVGSGRLELARAIADPSNPLTARVLVNRLWQHLFGRGLVGTPSNFGLLGERPTHPELLDSLAARFVASGWSIKQLHREILLSATYRLASDPGSEPRDREFTTDPDNRLLWRQNRRRLDIEAWRDAMLAVSGNLDPALGGSAMNLNDPGNRRRTLYAAISRHELNGTLRLFDFPDPNLTSEKRVSTTVPMQQLFVLNSEFLVRQAKSLSQKLASESTADDQGRIERVYSLIFQRAPTEEEVQIGLGFLQAPLPTAVSAGDVKLTAWEQYTQALLGTNEFAFVD